jgi:hypothetical protein
MNHTVNNQHIALNYNEIVKSYAELNTFKNPESLRQLIYLNWQCQKDNNVTPHWIVVILEQDTTKCGLKLIITKIVFAVDEEQFAGICRQVRQDPDLAIVEIYDLGYQLEPQLNSVQALNGPQFLDILDEQPGQSRDQERARQNRERDFRALKRARTKNSYF